VYVNHHRLVGFGFGPGHLPVVQRASGLNIGDALGRARALCGKRLTTSGNKGGAWFASTTQGRLDGFLSPSTVGPAKLSAKILTNDVGIVGCPAMSP
jgi:hypothetical protein